MTPPPFPLPGSAPGPAPPLRRSDDVAEAQRTGHAVVALESTVITHGLPHPRNLQIAHTMEEAVRARGAVPATIAVLDGEIRVGLTPAQLERLAAGGIAKLSSADLAACLATGGSGGTTVAATLICADLAGIAVFATGGIGGVHRGAQSSFDISADLPTLAARPLTVVAAGAKAILDLPATLEVLETLGVPVIAHGQDGFPAFWSRESGLRAPLRADSAAEVAAMHVMRRRLGLPGGQLLANPIPAQAQIPHAQLAPLIERAVADAAAQGIAAKAVTPFLLDWLARATDGATIDANIALLQHNAATGADIATALNAAPAC